MISAEITKTRSTIIGSIQALDEHAQEEQEHTRLGIIEFRSSTEARMRELREDMDKKHMELKNLLLAANKTHNTRQRGSLQERSKAVSAALVAYKVIYENLQVSQCDTHRSIYVPLILSRQYSQLSSLRSTQLSSLIALEILAEGHLMLLTY